MAPGTRRTHSWLTSALSGLAVIAVLSLTAISRFGGGSSSSLLDAKVPAAAQLDADARHQMEADISAAVRRERRAADERSASEAWSPVAVLGPRATDRRVARRRAEQKLKVQRQALRAQHVTAEAKAEYLRNAPENITWSPYHIILAKPGSKAHREGKFGTARGKAPSQALWTPEWKQEPSGGSGFTLRMYGLNSDCIRGAGQAIVCPRKWIPHDYLTDWDDHGEDDRGGLHSWEGSAVVPDVTATSMGWFTGKIPGSSKSFLAVWWGQLPIVLFDDYEFCCSSARDGIRLFLNGKLLVDNDGRGSRSEKCEKINLDPGNHHIRVDGFQVDGSGGGGTSKICKYRGIDTGGSKVNLKSNNCCKPGYVLPIPEGYSGVGYDEKAINNNGAKGEHNKDEGGGYVKETVADAEADSGGGGGHAAAGSNGDDSWAVELFVFYPCSTPLTAIPNLGDIEPQSYLGDWKEGGPYFSTKLKSLPITWGDIDGEASGYSMLVGEPARNRPCWHALLLVCLGCAREITAVGILFRVCCVGAGLSLSLTCWLLVY